jgi:hypothetical protein
MDKWATPFSQGFTVERHESFAVQLITDDGYQFFVNQQQLSVEFKHRLKVKPHSGGLPTAELISKPRPYTVVLQDVASKAIELSELVSGSKTRALSRIGIVSTTTVAEGDAPPGVARFLKFLVKPWPDGLDHFAIQIAAYIAKTDEYTDKCIHGFTKPEDPEQLNTLRFDWQRTFTTPKIATPDVLKKQTMLAQKAALEYFEQLGEGGRFDDNLIGRTA